MTTITVDSWDQNKKLDASCYPMSQLDSAKVLEQAWITLFGYKPSIDCLSVLFAQFGLETGYGKFSHNYNWGNIKSSPQDGYMWCEFKCNEIINNQEIWYSPPSIYCRFRAFKTAYDGAINYIGFLSQKKGYANAWAEVIKGDPVNFCAQLKASHYFTADLGQYTAGVVSICNQFKTKYSGIDLSTHILPPNDKDIEPFTPEEITQIQSQLGLSLDKSIQEYFASSRTPDDDSNNYNEDSATIPLAPPKTVWSYIKDIFGSK
jgi:hypothetical protein